MSFCVWLLAAGNTLRCHTFPDCAGTRLPSGRDTQCPPVRSATTPSCESRSRDPRARALPLCAFGKLRSHCRRVSRVCVLISGCPLNATTRTPTRERLETHMLFKAHPRAHALLLCEHPPHLFQKCPPALPGFMHRETNRRKSAPSLQVQKKATNRMPMELHAHHPKRPELIEMCVVRLEECKGNRKACERWPT